VFWVLRQLSRPLKSGYRVHAQRPIAYLNRLLKIEALELHTIALLQERLVEYLNVPHGRVDHPGELVTFAKTTLNIMQLALP
jgi:hypothetical protein